MKYETKAEWYIGCIKEKGMLGMTVTFPVTYSMKYESGTRMKLKDCISVYEMKSFKERVERGKIYNFSRSGSKGKPLWGSNYPVFDMITWNKVKFRDEAEKKLIVLGMEYDGYLVLDMDTDGGTRVYSAEELKSVKSTFDGRERHLIPEDELKRKQGIVSKLKYILDPELWKIRLGAECEGAMVEGTILFDNINLHLGDELRIPDKIEHLKRTRFSTGITYTKLVGGRDIIRLDSIATREGVSLESVEIEGPIDSAITINHTGDSDLGGLYTLRFPNAVRIKEIEVNGLPDITLRVGKNTLVSDDISIEDGSYRGKLNIIRE